MKTIKGYKVVSRDAENKLWSYSGEWNQFAIPYVVRRAVKRPMSQGPLAAFTNQVDLLKFLVDDLYYPLPTVQDYWLKKLEIYDCDMLPSNHVGLWYEKDGIPQYSWCSPKSTTYADEIILFDRLTEVEDDLRIALHKPTNQEAIDYCTRL